jgi:hypothetical protein
MVNSVIFPSKSIESFYGSDRDDTVNKAGKLWIEGDEGVRLEASEGDIFCIEGVGQPELVGDLPGALLQDTVS